MIARWSFAALMIALAALLYWLAFRVMRAIDLLEQIIDREHVVTLPEVDEPEDVEPADWYGKLKAAAAKVDALMQPTFLEPEQLITQPSPAVRPSPVPREVEPMPVTVPMERAWEESAAELTEHDTWQAEQDAKHAEFMAWLDGVAKGEVV